ncbi:hypothetical protein LS73_005470 [Helicobacter muridarum]|uniref:Uncharacterized protein n=1 Tax=Helicobacter muridarum TaxID=216 RepID=A0A099U1S4_9HELI|nr:hypothetical protein [Helicobacter muridarum]TLE00142.1 hypothetical protein LS73_005470 [Helicobacter muridarum]STQ87055.1 Uncharacterised protein [Helicobacter muridarum]
MNRLARIILIVGAVIILLLLIIIPFLSQKVVKSIQEHLNNGMEYIQTHISNSHNDFGIKKIEYSPFECSGISDYECNSKSIALYGDDALEKGKDIEYVRFSNISLRSKDVSDKNRFSLNVSTSIEYLSIDRLLKDSENNSILNFFIHNANVLLPNKLTCEQNYLHHNISTQDSKIITANNICFLESSLFNSKIHINSLFYPDVEKSHILGVLYEIFMAINGDVNNPKLQHYNIPHVIDSISITLESKKTFAEYINSDESLTSEQKQNLQRNFDSNINLIYLSAPMLLSSYFGNQSRDIVRAIGDVAKGKKKQLLISFASKNNDSSSFKPLKFFRDMNIYEWLKYLGENYNLVVETND